MDQYDVLDDFSVWHTVSCLEPLAETVLGFTQTEETIVDEDNGIENDMICKECNWDAVGDEHAEDVKGDGDCGDF